MNQLKWTIAAATLCLFAISSCKKDDSDAAPPSVIDYTRLTPGNYWIYESYMVDSIGNGQPGSFMNGAVFYDSVYVEKDTSINGYIYHKLMTPINVGNAIYSAAYLRDSLNYEVDRGGAIVLAPDNYSQVFKSLTRDAQQISYDSIVIATIQMADKDKIVTVPAGTFTTIAMATTWTFIPFKMQQQPVSPTRPQYNCYAKGIGMIRQTMPFYVSIPDYEERWLVRYHVQ